MGGVYATGEGLRSAAVLRRAAVGWFQVFILGQRGDTLHRGLVLVLVPVLVLVLVLTMNVFQVSSELVTKGSRTD